MLIFKYVFCVVAGYLLGSLSFSIFISRLKGSDVRSKGSGNAGATNMARIYGMGLGVLTLLGDALKAAVALVIGWLLLGEWGLFAGGFSCLLGHCFPVFHQFRGGKGISAGAAIAMALDWRVFVTVVVVFFVVALLSRKVSFGSVCAAIAIFAASAALGLSLPRLLLSGFGMVLVVFQHRENIRRLIKGTEPDFHAAKYGKKARLKKES